MSESIFYFVGYVTVVWVCSKILYGFIKTMYHYYIGYTIGMTPNIKSYGGWCVITGCTDGIGKAYVHSMAKRGINVVLISRTLEKLEKLSKEVEETYGVKTRVVQADFTGGREIYSRIKESIGDLEIGILVNNVGMANTDGGVSFSQIPNRDEFLEDILRTNVYSYFFMTSMILPEMLARRRGLILNLSSILAVTPVPGILAYGSTKILIDYFSRTLHMECKDKGVFVQSILPGFVSTKMSKSSQSWSSPLPQDYVEAQLRTVGLSEKTYGYFPHVFVGWVLDQLNLLPDFMRHSILMNWVKMRVRSQGLSPDRI
ncbi:let-767 (predicted) [Pycnogonum litorale]